MSNLPSCRGILILPNAVLFLVSLLTAQEKKVYGYTVGSRAVMSSTNNYGPVTVSASGNDEITVTTFARSDAVTFENEQHGNRVELRASSRRQGTNLIDWSVSVPTAILLRPLRTIAGRLPHAYMVRPRLGRDSAQRPRG
jgi:hypothetical protein